MHNARASPELLYKAGINSGSFAKSLIADKVSGSIVA